MPSANYPSRSAYDIVIEKLNIRSDRLPDERYDIKNVLVQMDVYESISKPFLTADLAIIDHTTLIKDVDFQGTEYIDVTFRIPETEKRFERTFIVEKIERSVKGTDTSELILLSLIEDVGFKNYLINVNRSFHNLRPDDIITIMSVEYFDKSVDRPGGLDLALNATPFTCIIPNWHPFTVTKWLTDRLSAGNGVPFFFYRTINDQAFILNNLQTMLTSPPAGRQYIMSQLQAGLAAGSADPDRQSYIIEGYSTSTVENYLDLIRRGYNTGTYESVDITTEIQNRKILRYSAQDLMKDVVVGNQLTPANQFLPFDQEFTIDGRKLDQYDNRRFTEITASNTYHPGTPVTASYADTGYIDKTGLAPVVKAMASKAWIQKNNILLSLPGRNFIGEDSTTLGDRIDVAIQGNMFSREQIAEEILDQKRSGQYMICAIKHTFQPRKYKVTLDGLKVSSLKGTTTRTSDSITPGRPPQNGVLI